MKPGAPASLKVTIPLVLLGLAAALSAVNLLYHAPRAERAVELAARERMAQEMSRLQSTLEYLLLKGDIASAQHEVSVLSHSHEVGFAALADDRGEVIASTRRAWLGHPVSDALPDVDLDEIRELRPGMGIDENASGLIGHARILMGSAGAELRPSRYGAMFLGYDLRGRKAEARALVLRQSLTWAGWVTALALAMWLVLHFLLTRRTAQLVHAAEEIATGNLDARSGLDGRDELGRLGRAFDAMARRVADTNRRLRRDLETRVRIQRDLENSEARLQQILDNATAVVSVKDTDGRFLFVNREWERLFRLTQAEVVGRTEEECLAEDVAGPHRANDRLVLAANAPMEFEEVARLDDGPHTYISIKFPLHDAGGRAYAVCGISTDITERKRADEALRASEASYRAIFDAAEDAIFVRDIDSGAIVDANPKACAAFGYTRDEFRRLDPGTLGSGESPYGPGDAAALFRRAVAGEELRFEWRGRAKSGERRWYDVFGRRVKIGGRDRVLVLARDVTDRKAAESALRASEEQYHAMFNASIDGLALWNEAGERVDTNPALWRIYGYASGPDPSNRSVASGPTYPESFLRSAAAGQAVHTELQAQRQDGSVLELDLHAIPMQYQGRPHVLTIARDITERKRSAEELARQRESIYQREKLAALGALLAGVSHELNNPLSVVVARAVLLEEHGEPETQAAARKIRTAAERCARIVRTFLAMARQQRPARGPVAIREVVDAALDIAAYALRTSGVEVAVDCPPDLPRVFADADQLHQVMLNLLINAQQALQDRPLPRRIRVTGRFDVERRMLAVTVADNGPGIPSSLRARVFEPFFTTKPSGAGTGIGLAVSLGIAEAHGGSLSVDDSPDGGVAFTVSLPVGELGAEKGTVPSPAGAGDARRSILIVDDERDIRDALAEILGGAQGRVVTAASGSEALDRLADEAFDVILTDVRMPGLDGRALYEEIVRRWPGRARNVVFVTGDTLATSLREFVRSTGQPVIEKPFLPGEVRRVVAELGARGSATAAE
ncbi:MAG TPA: PAS domain S-box protein [Casimicrobiaceae bacterium]|nr:PAS domain S-box protein [Casimicrobiaceae bacterium]